MKKTTAFAFACLLSLLTAAQAAPSDLDALPAYKPMQPISGEIRVWGSPADGALLDEWAQGFRRFHPDAHIAATLHGPESTMAGVYNDVADLAFMAREMRKPVESMAFAWAHHYPAFSVDIANAGLRADRPSANLAIFVNRDNPLSKLTLAQLASILGGEQKHGRGNIRTWGELGLGGDWKDRPIHVYGPAVDSISALFVRSTVLHDSYKWNPGYRELTGTGPEILAVLAHDPAGITYAPLRGSNDSVKPLALAASEDGPFFALTEQNAAARTYPLTRVVTMVLRRPPGKPIDPQVKEFLRYILSRDGQAAIVHDAAYLPLNAAQAQQQLEKLD